MNAQSYLGIPLWSSSHNVIGHMVIVDDKPMSEDPLWISVLQTFAAAPTLNSSGNRRLRDYGERSSRSSVSKTSCRLKTCTCRRKLAASNFWSNFSSRSMFDPSIRRATPATAARPPPAHHRAHTRVRERCLLTVASAIARTAAKRAGRVPNVVVTHRSSAARSNDRGPHDSTHIAEGPRPPQAPAAWSKRLYRKCTRRSTSELKTCVRAPGHSR